MQPATNANGPLRDASDQTLIRLRSWLKEQVQQGLRSTGSLDEDEAKVRRFLDAAYQHANLNLPDDVRSRLFYEVQADILGYGPLGPLLDDPTVTEIMVNRAGLVFIERDGKVTKAELKFPDDAAVLDLIHRIIVPLGRRIDRNSPTVDARLRDGSRVNAVIPPVAIDGPCLTIRKFARERMTMEDLIRIDSLDQHMAYLLRACVASRLNILIGGGTSSGKTTLLNILSSFIPDSERIVTIEDAAELQLHQENVVRLEAKPPDADGEGEVPIRHLVRNALRMRPDRIVVGEVRGGEALDMLQAMNTGHEGSLATLHANSPRDATSRLETLTLMSGFDLPLRVIREQIVSAIDVVVQQSRMRDGSRKVTSISEVSGMEGDTVVMSEIFHFRETGVDQQGNVKGEYRSTGIRPMFERRLVSAGFRLPPEMFGVDSMRMKPPTRAR